MSDPQATEGTWTHNELDGWIALDGIWVAWTTPDGWRVALSHPRGDDVIVAARSAIWRAPNNVSTEELRRQIAALFAEAR